ncbi:solute carrier family 40 member 1-like isoform X1 [Marmota marmota marmota]|uniref:solute carrier family 40 member 1-like isoform X1 n=1 Tax=Marmota marmota marmota TaxID=9994 RepID=UPI00209273C7|nr:solute carrier family 40 member 1-like isoform X1 [Marmota marmota marmota]
MSPSPSALTYHPRRAPARAYCAGRSRVAETAGLSFDNPQDTFAPPALSAQSGACSNPHVWFRSRWLRCFIIHLSLRLLESPVRDPDPPAVCSHVVIMVGELNDIENPGNEEKQTKTASTKHMKGETSSLGAILIYLMGPRFLIYVSCALSIWGDQMWHFAMSVFLIELYGHNLLLTAVFGLVVAGSVLIFGVLIGDWIDRKPRNKVAHASLFIQNASVTACCVLLMLLFSYRREMEQIWHGWFTVACYTVLITLAAVANLAGTALTITIQRDWIVSLTGGNGSQLAGMNAAVRRLDQIINIFAPLSVGQVMTWASHVIGCGFILGWNLVSLLVEFLFLSRVYQLVPQLAVKPQQQTGKPFLEKQQEAVNVQGEIDSWETSDGFINKPGTSKEPKDCRSHLEGQWVTTKRFLLCLRNTQRLLHTCREGWETYCRQTIFLPGLGLAFLYMTVLGFDCITTGYAYTQGIGGFLLSILTALSALSGLMGTILFTWLRGHYGLVTTGVISSWLHVGCLTLCVFSVFAPGSPFDTAVSSLPLSKNSSSSPKLLKDDQVHIYPFERNLNQPILPDRSSIHWTNSTVLFDGQQDLEQPESYVSIILLFSGVILARIGLWSFDLTVTQLLQENIPEAERGAVNGVQCSLNYLMDLIHFILVMLAPQPQQFGMLVFISMLFVTTGHVLYFFYARKCKIENSQVNETIKKGTWTPLS